MLIISSWLIARDFYDGEIAVAFAEDGVHFFQGAVGGFGVEEVYDWDHEGVAVEWSADLVAFHGRLESGGGGLHDGKDNIGLVLD